MRDLAGAYLVLALTSVAAIGLLMLAIHTICVTKFTVNKKDSLIGIKQKNGKLISFLIATVAGILFFEFAILAIIALIVQLILIHVHEFDIRVAFDEMRYLITIFDSLGHITMLYLFIARFEYSFKQSTFQHSKRLILSLYLALLVIVLFAGYIVVLIVFKQPATTILYLEIIWETIIELMCVWLLYLFITKLYHLLTLSFSRSNLFRDLTISIDVNLHKKQQQSQSKSTSTGASNRNEQWIASKNNKSEPVMDTDTAPKSPQPCQASVDEVANDEEVSPGTSPSVLRNERPDETYAQPAKMKHVDESKKNRNANDCDVQIAQLKVSAVRSAHIYAETRDVVNVMNKMTVLVLWVVVSSTLSVVGNVFIEMRGTQTNEQLHMSQIWTFVLPVFDMVVTALMMYLQFVFADHVYIALCGRFDMLLMRLCSSVIKYYWRKQRQKEEALAACVDPVMTSTTTSSRKTVESSLPDATTPVGTTPTNATSNTIEIIIDDEIP